METNIDYDIDVEGDVILTLRDPNEPFAVWSEENESWELPRSAPLGLDDELLQKYQQIDPAWQENEMSDGLQSIKSDDFPEEEPPPERTETPEASEAPEVPGDLSNPSTQETSDASDVSEMAGRRQKDPGDDENISNEVSQVRFRLSSRHLISASCWGITNHN